jgi:hypothetical protein
LVGSHPTRDPPARAFDYRDDERQARQRLATEPLESSRGRDGSDEANGDEDGDEDDEGNPALDAFDSNGARIVTDSLHSAAAGLIGLRGGIDEFSTCEAYTTPALEWLTLNHNVKTVLRCLRRVRSRCQARVCI